MNTRALVFALMAACAVSVPVTAQETEDADAESVASDSQAIAEGDDKVVAERDDERVQCRELAPKVGTRIPGRRVCLTQYQWRQWEENTKELMRDTERQGLTRNSVG